jgi:hypothetical protein
MNDFIAISFFLGHDQGRQARSLLQRLGLLDMALADRRNRGTSLSDKQHSGVWLTLPADDARIPILQVELAQRGVEPFLRFDREHSRRELDQAEWLLLRVATAGLWGGADFGQEFDFSDACAECGSGARLIGPLVTELGKMGKKEIDHVVYEGHLIVSQRLAAMLAAEGVTGIEAAAVRNRRGPVSDKFVWLRCTEMCRAFSARTQGVVSADRCATCGRGGHFANATAPLEVQYDAPPTIVDIAETWERNGLATDRRLPTQARPIGGSAFGIVASQRVRQILVRAKIPRLNWVPVAVAPGVNDRDLASNKPVQPTRACGPRG